MSQRQKAYMRSVSRWVLRRTGLIVAMSIVGVLVGILTGIPVLGLFAAVIVVVLWPTPRLEDIQDDDEGVEPTNGNRPWDPFASTIVGPASLSLADATRRLCSIGLRLVHDDGASVRLSGGSHLQTRLLGGYFINPAKLPISVTLEAAGPRDGVKVRIEDSLTLARRDGQFKHRYALRVGEIRDALNEGTASSREVMRP